MMIYQMETDVQVLARLRLAMPVMTQLTLQLVLQFAGMELLSVLKHAMMMGRYQETAVIRVVRKKLGSIVQVLLQFVQEFVQTEF